MNRQAFRSLAQRARPAVEQDFTANTPFTPTLGPLANYFRSFSSTTAKADDATSSPTSSSGNNASRGGRGGSALRARSMAAARGVGALTRGRGNFQARGGGGGSTGGAPAEGQKVLDVKVLPRGRGGLRGRGGGGFRGRGGGAGASAGNRFAGQAGAPRGRGGQRGNNARGRGRGRGRGGKKVAGKDGKEGGDRPKRPARVDGYDLVHETPEMTKFDEAMRFGEETVYTPSLTLKEDLAPFMPAVPSGAAANAASVMKNLATLGTGDRIGHPDILPASHYGKFLNEHGLRFFASTEQRAVAEEYLQEQQQQREGGAPEEGGGGGAIIKDAEESVKKVVLADAVEGRHEKPVYGEDVMSVVRSWGLREGSYGVEGRKKLEEKIGALLAKGPKPKVQPKPKSVK